jgi:hypothetical protein
MSGWNSMDTAPKDRSIRTFSASHGDRLTAWGYLYLARRREDGSIEHLLGWVPVGEEAGSQIRNPIGWREA